MNRFWWRIAVGAAIVFAVGMALITGARHGKAEISRHIGLGAVGAGMQAAHSLGDFVVDGRRLGEVRRLRILRDPGEASRMEATVDLADAAAADRLAGCAVLTGDMDELFDDAGLRCEAKVPAGYEEFGVVLAVADARQLRRPLYAAKTQVAEFDEHQDDDARVVDVRADEQGRTHVSVQNDGGTEVVRMQADSNGATMEVRNAAGRRLFRMRADSVGLDFSGRDRAR